MIVVSFGAFCGDCCEFRVRLFLHCGERCRLLTRSKLSGMSRISPSYFFFFVFFLSHVSAVTLGLVEHPHSRKRLLRDCFGHSD